jgi:lipopolysaccharide transport system ATP-binding protein
MGNIAIRAENLSKLYQIGVLKHRHDTLGDHLAHGFKSLLSWNGRRGPRPAPGALPLSNEGYIWALKDVSFEVKHGEVVGVIGRNGAGKSTLLKILSRITEPASGFAEIHGRVGSLLEVGTGFHRDLTGRDNIYLNGTILGMKRVEIKHKFDEIVDFSGIEKFIDTPIKRYSSGMYVRLAFAVAAHLELEVLIVDEVLAVGDAEFQRRCLGKIRDVAKEGRTVLFVSHDLAAVESLCHKGMMLEGGKLTFSGTAKEAVDYYLHGVNEREGSSSSHIVDLSTAAGRPSQFRPLLQRVELFTDGGKPMKGSLKIGASLKAYIYFRLEKLTSTVDCSLAIDNLSGRCIFLAHSGYQPNRPAGKWIGSWEFVCDIPSITLVPGEYSITVSLDVDNLQVDTVDDATRLTIIASDYYGTGKVPRSGMLVLKHYWHTGAVESCTRQ